jgi:AcrR family transcriptional regulator
LAVATPVSGSLEVDEVRERFIAAGLRVLHEHGATELTVRRVAEAAGSSTMGIYSRFGGRAGMLEGIYRRGYEQLGAALAAADEGGSDDGRDPLDRIVELSLAYRRFALANPALYALMFERPLAGFDPPAGLRDETRNMTFPLLLDAVAAAQRAGTLRGAEPADPAYLIWTATHGMTSIELTYALRSPLPDWFVDYPTMGERMLRDGVTAVLAGLGPHAGTDRPDPGPPRP